MMGSLLRSIDIVAWLGGDVVMNRSITGEWPRRWVFGSAAALALMGLGVSGSGRVVQ